MERLGVGSVTLQAPGGRPPAGSFTVGVRDPNPGERGSNASSLDCAVRFPVAGTNVHTRRHRAEVLVALPMTGMDRLSHCGS